MYPGQRIDDNKTLKGYSCYAGTHHLCQHPDAALFKPTGIVGDGVTGEFLGEGPCACPCHRLENQTRFPQDAEL
jgi:hypothetical protein